MDHRCPLCRSAGGSLFHRDERRTYWRCADCLLVFVPPEFFLSAEEERAHYDWHENDPRDARYRAFLSRLFDPLVAQLNPGSIGLDFGSGPGPTLSVMLAEAGHQVALYDPFYAPDPGVFDRSYDFITASEVVEHLHQPQRELDRLWGCLKPGGTLGVMTKLVRDQAAFRSWHYIHDPTHVCFYSEPTLQWLADSWQAELARIGDDVALFSKNH